MKDLAWLKHDLIAHRGLYKENGSIPENSKKAFLEAIDHGYAIECDLNITKDQQVVVFHDRSLKRLTGLDKNIGDVSYDEIKDLTLLISDQHIITLKALLMLVDGKVPLLLELKPLGDIKKLCQAVMGDMKSYQGKFAIFSFHPAAVLWFKRHHPQVIRGQISAFFDDHHHMRKPMKILMRRLFFNHFTKPDFISYYIHDLPNKHVDKAKKKGITVISYAAKTQKEFDFVKSHYDNVVFEYFLPKENA